MTPEEQNGLQMVIDAFAGSSDTPTPQNSVPDTTPTPQDQTISPQPAPTPTESANQSPTGQMVYDYPRRPAPTVYDYPRRPTDTIQVDQSLYGSADQLNNSITPESPQPTLSPKQVTESLGIPPMPGVTQRDVEDVNALKQSPNYLSTVGQGFRNRIDTQQAEQQGKTVDQLRADNAWEPAPFKAVNTPKQNPIRLALGNTVEAIGDAIPGMGEHNVSEGIAGGPTKHSGQVMATDNIQVVEPYPNAQYQPGAGIDALKGRFQSAQSSGRGIVRKPPMEDVSGMNRSVGNFVGQTAATAAQIKAPMPGNKQSFNTPPMSAPAMELPQSNNEPIQSYNEPAQSYNQPGQSNSQSNSQSNNQGQSNNQNQSNNQPSQPSPAPGPAPRPAPRPAPSPINHIPPFQPIQVPITNVGVGSVRPPPTPTPAPTPPSSIFAPVIDLIRNLFRRK
jgi:hypothetical protein